MDLSQRHLDLLLCESHNATDTSSANTIRDGDQCPSLEPTHSRIMCCLIAKRDRHAGRKRLISREESR